MNLNPEYVIALSLLLSFIITFFIIPKIIRKMELADICGVDVNKKHKPKIPEMGGLSAVLGFSLGITLCLGIAKYFGTIDESPVLVSISIVCIASLIGLLDDVSILGRKEKAWFISLSSLPLIISQIGKEEINLIFIVIDFNNISLFFWLILVPLGITGCANALNMSAGYNGLESGQMLIMSSSLLIISILDSTSISIIIIYASISGSILALYLFNKYPAKIFVGDVGTLGIGSVLASTLIMSGHIFFGIICILPTFYELYSTITYSVRGIERRGACMNPRILDKGILKPEKGAEDYTLAFFLLSKFDLTEKQLVDYILFLYFICGISSILISFIF